MVTIEEFREFSLNVNNLADVPIGWNENSSLTKLNNQDHGFDAKVYEKTENNVKTIVIAFSCYDFEIQKFPESISNLHDLISISSIFFGLIPEQYNDAMALYTEVLEYYQHEPINIQFTGWSLGGAIAQLMGATFTSSNTVTFSAFGAGNISAIVDDNQEYNNISNYITMNDLFANINPQVGKTYLFLPNPIENNNTFIDDIHRSPIYVSNFETPNTELYIEKPDWWRYEHSCALVAYDKNFQNDNPDNIGIEYLKESINLINSEFVIITNKLHYTHNLGEYIIGTSVSDNNIVASSQNDIVWGHNGNDEIYGLSGNDILIGDSSSLTVQELEDLRYSEQEVNIVYFESENDGNDYLDGGEGEDLLIGCGGNDILIGGEDKDTLYGGSGNDLLIAGDTSKTQEELQNILNNNASFSVADFEADNSKNTLYGGIGNDLIIGDKGKDTIYGGNDDDIIYGGKGNDTIYGDDSNNVYTGNDVLVGGEGNDTLYGGNGNDVIIAGNTSLSVDSLKNLSAIKNSIDASAYQSQNGGENKLNGGNGNDLLIGDKGNDTLKGGSGDDYLYGGKGDDKLIGGTGNNYLYGGKGNDEYRLTAGSKNTIKDTDNIGSVYKGSQQLTGASKDGYKGNNVWIKNGVKYTWNEGSHILLINGGLATIKDFKNGALGITLEKPEDEPEPPEKADNDMTEPIVLDLDGNGFGTTNVSNGVYFDFNNDGFAEKIAWADDGDGVLVADLNNNGKIDNGTEVLTAETLSSFDTNNDGVINSEDENFANLKIMQNDGTVLSLADAGVESINTNITETDYTDENENFLFGEGSFTKTDGTINNFGEYYFKTDYTDTAEVDLIEETESVTALPDIENVGKLRSLHQAMRHVA